jgi:8-oxo-dGTP diphosphatase
MTYTSEYPIFYVTVDAVVLTLVEQELCALVVRRGSEPFEGSWALPGGFVEPEETLEQAVRRELDEETAVPGVSRVEQLAAYGDPDRDPRGRVVSVAWLAVVPEGPEVTAGSDAASAAWRPVRSLLEDRLAFDHRLILADAVDRCRSRVEHTAFATAFLGEEFTVADLRGAYEAVLGERLDPGNFHRRATAAGFIEPTGTNVQRGPGRPAATYRRVPEADGPNPPLTRSALE